MKDINFAALICVASSWSQAIPSAYPNIRMSVSFFLGLRVLLPTFLTVARRFQSADIPASSPTLSPIVFPSLRMHQNGVQDHLNRANSWPPRPGAGAAQAPYDGNLPPTGKGGPATYGPRGPVPTGHSFKGGSPCGADQNGGPVFGHLQVCPTYCSFAV